MHARIPRVKRTNQRYACCVWCPHGKRRACHIIHHARMGAKFFPKAQVTAFAKQVQIDFTNRWQKAIRIVPINTGAVSLPNA